MSVELTKGVTLHVFPTKKFKTIKIKIKLKAPLQQEIITQRAFLANLLETNSSTYPTQTAIQSELSNMYGASFYTDVTKKGAAHLFSLDLSVVNDKYLSSADNVLNQALVFLEEVLFHPNVQDNQFHPGTFKREKENLQDEYSSYYDDKQLYAELALQELYFDTHAQKIPGRGREEDLENITPHSLYDYYKKMMAEDEVDILVTGDVSEEQMTNYFKKLPFTPRKIVDSPIFHTVDRAAEWKERTEIQPIVQAKFNLAYDTGIYYHDQQYYAGQVFNGLFGGFPHSKLFLNVREKESLAYYASSSMDTFRGMMTVQTGIEGANASKVEAIIGEQLAEIQKGNVDEEAFLQTKEMLKNGLYQSEDHPSSYLEHIYANKLAKGKTIPIDEWVQQIENVTKEDVMAVAQNVTLKARFLLKGEQK